MSHTYTANRFHIVFSTAGRRRFIAKDKQDPLYAYIGGIARNHNFRLLSAGGIEDHIHLLVALPPTIAVAKAVQTLKANSSKWMRDSVRGFAWQEGYSSFSVSVSTSPAVLRYIQNQEAHHRKQSFEEELRTLLLKHEVAFDERFLLD